MPVFEIKSDYLLTYPSDAYALESYRQALDGAASICRQNGLTRILADVRSIESFPTIDKYELGVHVAQLWEEKSNRLFLREPMS